MRNKPKFEIIRPNPLQSERVLIEKQWIDEVHTVLAPLIQSLKDREGQDVILSDQIVRLQNLLIGFDAMLWIREIDRNITYDNLMDLMKRQLPAFKESCNPFQEEDEEEASKLGFYSSCFYPKQSKFNFYKSKLNFYNYFMLIRNFDREIANLPADLQGSDMVPKAKALSLKIMTRLDRLLTYSQGTRDSSEYFELTITEVLETYPTEEVAKALVKLDGTRFFPLKVLGLPIAHLMSDEDSFFDSIKHELLKYSSEDV